MSWAQFGTGYSAGMPISGSWQQYAGTMLDPTASAQIAAGAQVGAAQQSAMATEQAAQAAAQAQVKSAQTAAEASRYSSDQQLAGINAQIGYKQGLFNKVFPIIQGQVGNTGGLTVSTTPSGYASNVGQLGGGGSYGYGGPGGGYSGNLDQIKGEALKGSTQLATDVGNQYQASQAQGNQLLGQLSANAASPLAPPTLPNAPTISQYVQPTFQQAQLLDPRQMPVVSQDLLNQQINQAFGSNAQAAATAQRTSSQGVAGRGLGADSPMARSLNAQIQGSMIGANSQAALAAQQNAANLNAQYTQAMNQALINQAASVYGSQTQGALGGYQSMNQALANLYGTQVGGLTSIYGTQAGAQASLENARRQALASAFGNITGLQGQQLGLQGQMAAAQLGYQGQITAADLAAQASRYGATTAANANIYGTNVGYQQAIQAAQIAAAASRQNAILQSLANFAS